MTRTLHRAIAIAILVMTVVACGGAAPSGTAAPTQVPSQTSVSGASQTPSPSATRPTATATSAATDPPTGETGDPISRFGYGPTADPSVTYQPDVVLIGGGPAAIRAVSADGMTWTVDAAAAGVDQLALGKVMFASSDGVGRILAIEDEGDQIAVTLAPVSLGEVISDAHIVLDRQVSLDALQLIVVPQPPESFEDDLSQDLSGAVGDAEALTIRLPEIRLAGYTPADGPVAGGSEKSAKVGDWTLTGYRGAGTIGLRAEHGLAGDGLKVKLDAHIEVADLHVIADVPISRGVVGQSNFEVTGITGLSLSIEGGAGNGLADNRKVRIEIPIQLSERVIIGGFPATLTQTFKFFVESAFTAKNGNLSAGATWSVDGPLGFDGKTLTTPTIAQRGTTIVDSIAGVSVGVNGLVAAVSFKFGLIIGLPIAGAGPFANLVLSLGLTNGSSLGIVKCRQSTVTSTLTAGVGIQVFDPIKKALKKFWGVDIPEETEFLTKTLLQQSLYTPVVAACKL